MEETTGAAQKSATPEADRVFNPPDEALAARALRELEWGEQFVVQRVSPARGNMTEYLYSLDEAAGFFLDGGSAGVTLATHGAYPSFDWAAFVAWVEDVVGDVPLAEALRDAADEDDSVNDAVAALRRLLALRMAQYERVRL